MASFRRHVEICGGLSDYGLESRGINDASKDFVDCTALVVEVVVGGSDLARRIFEIQSEFVGFR